MESFFIFFYTIGDECYDLTSFFQWVTEKHGRQWYMWYHKAFPRKLVIILLLFLGHMRVSWDHVIFTNIYSKLILKEWLPIKSVGKVRQWNSYSFVKIVGILDLKKNLVILLNIYKLQSLNKIENRFSSFHIKLSWKIFQFPTFVMKNYSVEIHSIQ